MNNMSTITSLLAQSSESSGISIPQIFAGLSIENVWEFIVRFSWIQAIFALAFGVIYLIYGWRVFKPLVVINFAILGVFSGKYIGSLLGSPLWGAIMGCLILSAVSWPFMKYAVSVLGALAGAVIGLAISRSIGLPDSFLAFGVLIGVITGGLLAFSSFKVSIMLFTSLQGSAFMVIGSMALLHDYPSLSPFLTQAVTAKAFLLPLMLICPTVMGMFLQYYLLRHEEDWAMPE